MFEIDTSFSVCTIPSRSHWSFEKVDASPDQMVPSLQIWWETQRVTRTTTSLLKQEEEKSGGHNGCPSLCLCLLWLCGVYLCLSCSSSYQSRKLRSIISNRKLWLAHVLLILRMDNKFTLHKKLASTPLLSMSSENRNIKYFLHFIHFICNWKNRTQKFHDSSFYHVMLSDIRIALLEDRLLIKLSSSKWLKTTKFVVLFYYF